MTHFLNTLFNSNVKMAATEPFHIFSLLVHSVFKGECCNHFFSPGGKQSFQEVRVAPTARPQLSQTRSESSEPRKKNPTLSRPERQTSGRISFRSALKPPSNTQHTHTQTKPLPVRQASKQAARSEIIQKRSVLTPNKGSCCKEGV